MAISKRSAEILRELCRTEGRYVPVGELAQALSVSAKTVSRELPEVERLLAVRGMALSRKAGAGVRLEGGSEALSALALELAEPDRGRQEYTPEERRTYLLTELLQAAEPVKLFALASHLDVTDGTVSNDLGRITGWLQEQHLKLVRRPGLGVYIEGTEDARRRAIIRHLYEHMDEKALLGLVAGKNPAAPQETSSPAVSRAQQELLQLVGRHELVRIETLLREERAQKGWQLSDNAFIGLLVHLALAVTRIRQGEEIRMPGEVLSGLQASPEFILAAHLATRLGDAFDLPIPPGEIGYITMHLQGARSRYHEQHLSGLRLDNFHLVKLAKGVIARAEELRGTPFARPQALLAGLVNHLGPTLRRLQLGLDIRNPLLKEMRERYPELMSFTRQCLAGLEQEMGEPLPEAEVAYIAMHLGAASTETRPREPRQLRVAVACPTGMGTSRLLAAAVRRECPQVIVADQVSALTVDGAYAERLGLDFVIATVPLPEAPVPVVVVSPLLDEKGRAAIEAQCKALEEQAGPQRAASEPSLPFDQALGKVTEYNRAILDMLAHFFAAGTDAGDITAVCRLAGKLAEEQMDARFRQARGVVPGIKKGIAQGLLAREEAGGTLLSGQQMVLLHCRSIFVPCPMLGILHLAPGFRYPAEGGELLRTAIVMLAPQEASAIELETIGHLSAILLDRWGLINVLHEGSPERIREELVGIFKEFQAQKQKELLG